ncbi:anaerobic sulfatase maturase [Desulfobacula sp.]|uniref:anaerobic sulfatase maturase n=1 Tax=Desulfobacula sp. TaxID=2593537 RepID=UPI0025BD7463|nr:anaerobic sulfatase maturase [Desulfobacula sp.]MBC2705952.1 anaerobic sulfatase maturase [Desulfobacula sp.]
MTPRISSKVKTDFQVFVKPVGDLCNMACHYCYYSSGGAVSDSAQRMPDDILETYICQHIQAHPGPVVRFSWHGGEPTLLGIDFFKKAVAFQKKYQPAGVLIQNGIQTNGTLLDETWCRFLKKEGFSVGLSLDGPEHLHNRYRTTKSGKGTHSRVMLGQQLLQKNQIPYDILCVVHHHNVDHPLDVYRFFKRIGAVYIGFLPVINSLTDSVDPEKYGTFLCSIFDEWKTYDIGRIKVQMFEEVCAKAMGQDHALCIFRKACGEIPVVEINGDVYPCDHFVRPAFKLGNLNTTPLGKLMNLKTMREFGKNKKTGLASQCKSCEVLAFYNGGCPKDRILHISGSTMKLNHLCRGYKRFFNHCLPFVEQLQKLMPKQQQEDKPVRTGRNSPCPCGSGKKFKRCCMTQ